MDAETIKTTLLERSQQTLSATVDGRSATGHSLKDLIEAHRYLSSLDTAAETPNADGQISFGLKTARIQPGGAA